MKFKLLTLLVRVLDWTHACPTGLAENFILEAINQLSGNVSLRDEGYSDENNSIRFTLKDKSGIIDGIVVGVDINFLTIYKSNGIENVPMQISGFPHAIKNTCLREARKLMKTGEQSNLLLYFMAVLRVSVIETLVAHYDEQKMGEQVNVEQY